MSEVFGGIATITRTDAPPTAVDATWRHVYRPLTFSERSFVDPATSEIIGMSLDLIGELDVAAMRTAFGELLAEYPVLTATIGTEDGVPVFVAGDADHVAYAGFRQTFAPWAGYAQRAPSEISSLELLCAIGITSDGDRHRVTLWASHCVTDGGGLAAMTTRLFQMFSAATGAAPQPARHRFAFPREPHLVMAEHGVSPKPVPYEARLEGTSWSGTMTSSGHYDDTDDVERIRFTRSISSGFRDAAATQGVSTHALISGAIATAEMSALTTADPAVALLFPVDFRSRVEPPIALADVTALVGFTFASTRCADATEPAAIARVVHDQLRRDFADGTVFHAAVSPMPDPATRRHGPPVIISNLGRFPAVDLPQCLTANDFHCQIVRSAVGLREYSQRWDSPGMAPVPAGSTYLVSIFDDRLSVEMRVLPGTLDRRTRCAILSCLNTLVHEISAAVPPSGGEMSEMSTWKERTVTDTEVKR